MLKGISALLVVVPLLLATYHRLRRRSELDIDFVAFMVLFVTAAFSSLLFTAVDDDIWPLIFPQLLLVVPATVWGIRRLRAGEVRPGMSNRAFLVVMRGLFIASTAGLILAGTSLDWPGNVVIFLAAAFLAAIAAVVLRRFTSYLGNSTHE